MIIKEMRPSKNELKAWIIHQRTLIWKEIQDCAARIIQTEFKLCFLKVNGNFQKNNHLLKQKEFLVRKFHQLQNWYQRINFNETSEEKMEEEFDQMSSELITLLKKMELQSKKNRENNNYKSK